MGTTKRNANWTVHVVLDNTSGYFRERDFAEDLIQHINKWLDVHKVVGIVVAKYERTANPHPEDYKEKL